jgi:hypothetical protein
VDEAKWCHLSPNAALQSLVSLLCVQKVLGSEPGRETTCFYLSFSGVFSAPPRTRSCSILNLAAIISFHILSNSSFAKYLLIQRCLILAYECVVKVKNDMLLHVRTKRSLLKNAQWYGTMAEVGTELSKKIKFEWIFCACGGLLLFGPRSDLVSGPPLGQQAAGV